MSDIQLSTVSNAQLSIHDDPTPLQGWDSAMSQLEGALESVKHFNKTDPCYQLLMGSLSTLESYVKKAGGSALGDFEQLKNDLLYGDRDAARQDLHNLSEGTTPALSSQDFEDASADAMNVAINESFINNNPTPDDMNAFQGFDAMMKDFLGKNPLTSKQQQAYQDYQAASGEYQAGVSQSGEDVKHAINALLQAFSS